MLESGDIQSGQGANQMTTLIIEEFARLKDRRVQLTF
ncbi:hypothetical protein LINPERHAP2_LOCUS14727 [Linum perenne]